MAAIQIASVQEGSERCVCPVGHVLTDYNSSGVFDSFYGKHCLMCPFNSYVDNSDPYTCIRCPDPLMHRDATSGRCVCADGYVEDSVQIASTIQVDEASVGQRVCLELTRVREVAFSVPQYGKQTYFDVLDAGGARTEEREVDRSEPHMLFFLEAAVRCRGGRRTESCHALANLCTLNLFDMSSPACSVLSSYTRGQVVDNVHDYQGWHLRYPWLWYEDTPRNVLLDTGLNRPVALSGPNSFINMTLSVYSLDGTLVGMRPLTTQLLLCKGDDRELQRYRRFGSNVRVECDVDVLAIMRDFSEPHFYELWIVDSHDSDGNILETPTLYPVPVMIINYRDDGDTPNRVLKDSNLELGVGSKGELAMDQVVLHRRFFLYDNIGGRIVADSANTQTGPDGQRIRPDLEVVRWAKAMQLRIALQSNQGDTPVDESLRMYPPQLIIEYEQMVGSTVPTREVEGGSEEEKLRYQKVSFRSTYTRDSTFYWYITMVLFVVLAVLIVVQFFVKAAVHNQTSSLKPLEIGIDLLGCIGNFFFVFLLGMSGYWFIFFKLQTSVKVLILTQDPHKDYIVLVSITVVCKVLQVALLVYKQCTVRIFFIDWEKEKEGRNLDLEDGNNENQDSKDKPGHPNVSVWRSILIANEWCEMQGERHTDVDFTLMFLLLFLAGLNYQNLATAQPDERNLEDGPPSMHMRFFVISMWYFTVVVMQLGWRLFSYRFQSDPLDQFVDLCQLSNISTWILDRDFHGFYIHGRSVHPHTDVNMFQMQTNLKDESDAKRPNRGLTQKPMADLQGYTDLVFEVYITDAIKKEYSSQFKKMLPHGGVPSHQNDQKAAEAVSKAHHTINEFLMNDVIDTISSANVQIPTFAHNVLGVPPGRVPPEQPVLLRDNKNLFARVLFYGIEGDLIILDLLVFIVWDLIFVDVFIAALLTYVLAHGLMELRCKFGTSNVARKTLVDERFLI